MSTFLEIQTEVALQLRMDLGKSAHETNVENWINWAQQEVAARYNWWFLQAQYELTTLLATRTYAFPTTDEDGAAAALVNIDVDSMRTKSSALEYASPSALDRMYRNWTDPTANSSPKFWTTVGENIALDKPPSSDWVSSYPKIYFRGWKEIVTLSDDGDESLIPAMYHWILIHGANHRGWIERGDERMAMQEKALFDRGIEQMFARSQPVIGEGRTISVPQVFRLRGGRGRRGVNVNS